MAEFIDYIKLISKKTIIHYGYTYSREDILKRFEENKNMVDSISYNDDKSIYLEYNDDNKFCYYDYIIKRDCDIINIYPDLDGDIKIYKSFYIINGVEYTYMREEIIIAAIKGKDIKYRVIFKRPPDNSYCLDFIIIKKIVNEDFRNILSNNPIRTKYLKYEDGGCY